MRGPLSNPIGDVFRPYFKALGILLVFGVVITSVTQRADAMTQRKQPKLGDILTESASGSLHCEIVTSSVPQSLELKGVVWSDVADAGSYSFVVTKQGVSGSSNVAQSGLFEISGPEKTIVGTVMVNALLGDRYLARLSARSGGNEVVCEITLQ